MIQRFRIKMKVNKIKNIINQIKNDKTRLECINDMKTIFNQCKNNDAWERYLDMLIADFKERRLFL